MANMAFDDYDPKYEFDAPNTYCDLNTSMEEDVADWFIGRDGGVEEIFENTMDAQPEKKAAEIEEPTKEMAKAMKKFAKVQKQKSKEELKAAKKADKAEKAAAPPPPAPVEVAFKPMDVTVATTTAAVATTTAAAAPPAATTEKTVSKPKNRSIRKIVTSFASAISSPRASRKRSKKTKAAPPTTPPDAGFGEKKKLTKPSTPRMLRRSQSQTKVKILSSEERAMQEIAEKKEEMNKRRRLSRESFEQNKRLSGLPDGGRKVSSHKASTIPQSPNFASVGRTFASSRPRSRNNRGTDGSAHLPSNPELSAMVLRTRSEKSKYVPGRTVPVPFKVGEKVKKAHKNASSPFKSLAQKIRKFTSGIGGTPDRFHKKAKSNAFVPAPPAPEHTLTKPEGPNLQTASRSKPSSLASTAQRDDAMMAKNAANSFKATPVSEAVLYSAGDYGVPVVHSKGSTVPMPFKQQESHRNPMDTRAALAAAKAEEEVARPRFHAQPIATGAAMQAVEAKAPTVPAPFKLAGDEHHSRSRAKLAAQKRLEEQARKAQTEFHATAIAAPAPAFVPAKSTRPLTEVQAFSLNGNARAAERDVYNRQAQMTRAKSQAAQDAAILDAEQRAMDVLRKQREFKGTAVPTYTVMKIKPSQRILTAPESPMVGKRGPTGIRA